MMRGGAKLLWGLLTLLALAGGFSLPAANAVARLPLSMIRLDRMQTGVSAPVEVAVVTAQAGVSRIDVTLPAGFGTAGAALSASNTLGFTPLPGALTLVRRGSTLSVEGIAGMNPGTPYGFTISPVTNPAPGQYVASVATLNGAGSLLEYSTVGLAVNLTDQISPNVAVKSVCVNADLNKNNRVDIFDLSIVLSTYATTNPRGDVNHDGVVNVFDLSRVLTCYGMVLS